MTTNLFFHRRKWPPTYLGRKWPPTYLGGDGYLNLISFNLLQPNLIHSFVWEGDDHFIYLYREAPTYLGGDNTNLSGREWPGHPPTYLGGDGHLYPLTLKGMATYLPI